jgi:hypothetical protein
MGKDDREQDPRNSNPDEEDAVLDAMQTSFTMWAMGVEIVRASLDEWAQLRMQHLQASSKALSELEQLPSDQKPAAASEVAFKEVESAIKDVGAAAFKAMTLAGTAARQFETDMKKNRFPFGMRRPRRTENDGGW